MATSDEEELAAGAALLQADGEAGGAQSERDLGPLRGARGALRLAAAVAVLVAASLVVAVAATACFRPQQSGGAAGTRHLSKALQAWDPWQATGPDLTSQDYGAGYGPREFSAQGGPQAIAGTKVVSGGADDLGTESSYTHVPAPVPPASYAAENPPVSMIMYRAQSDQDYPMRNVNTGDLAGVMWYLHNEIIGFPDPNYRIRHFNITRIIRFKATFQNPPAFFRNFRTKFGPYVAYNAGKCGGPGCDTYPQYGAVVGCQMAAQQVANYASPSGELPVWYSLPGPCPEHEYAAKDPACIRRSPGGDCGRGNPVTGAKDCSYYLQWYGEVRLDDFLPLSYYGRKETLQDFMEVGGREYEKETDKGYYTDFWDGIHDRARNQERVEAVLRRFAEKYPGYPVQSSGTPCDSPR